MRRFDKSCHAGSKLDIKGWVGCVLYRKRGASEGVGSVCRNIVEERVVCVTLFLNAVMEIQHLCNRVSDLLRHVIPKASGQGVLNC